MSSKSLLVAAGCAFAAEAIQTHESSSLIANPVRKVVTLLQSMQKRVSEEGAKEQKMFDAYMCYCKTNGGDLSSSISAGEAKTSALSTNIKASVAELAGAKEALKQAQTDRSAAKAAMEEAHALREKEAQAFATEKAMYDTNIAAIAKAIAALEKGMAGGAFVQTEAAQVLKKLILDKPDIADADRQDLVSFLSGEQGSDYAPSSGQITGILKQLEDEMKSSLSEATATEDSAIQTFDALMAAKKKEVDALIASIEGKMQRIGELGVSIAGMKNDLTATEEAIIADKEFRANLEKGCSTKAAEWDEIKRTRAEELVAIADTIKVLNDDDALELFKKTLPSGAASAFVQVAQRAASYRARALMKLSSVTASAAHPGRSQIDLIALALHGKKIGFGKVVKMIDSMIETLDKEQVSDNSKKEYCEGQIDHTDDKKKALERSVSDQSVAIANVEEGIAALKDEIAALEAGISSLDKSVAEATEQRQEEHKDFSDLMASDSAAKELLGFAKNRLQKFYNPKLYKPAPKVELSAEDRIFVSEGGSLPPTEATGIAGTGIAVLAEVDAHAAPPAPPASPGPYAKKSSESTGVIAMIDILIKDLDKELAEAATSEKDAQNNYEVLMNDSSAKRVADSASLTEKASSKAALESDLQDHHDAMASGKAELSATLEYMGSLHAECDWLLQYFEVRKTARVNEVDALKNAKAVLSGADYSF